jgi:hypothetical protein
MAKRIVIWTRTTDLQFVGILEYWVKRNKSNTYSKKLVKMVFNRTRQIAKNPFVYKLVDVDDVRVASMENFSIFYNLPINT